MISARGDGSGMGFEGFPTVIVTLPSLASYVDRFGVPVTSTK